MPVLAVLAGSTTLARGMTTPTVTLNNGVQMPAVIYGTGGAHTQDNVSGTVTATGLALSAGIGFAGIDGANHYHNQIGVRDAITLSGTPRSKLWVQSKIEPCGHSAVRHGHCYEDSLAAFNQNLQQLNVEHLDLTLIHSPPCVPNSTWADPMCRWDSQIYPSRCNCAAAEPCQMMQDQWRALEEMYASGKTRAIGVRVAKIRTRCPGAAVATRAPPLASRLVASRVSRCPTFAPHASSASPVCRRQFPPSTSCSSTRASAQRTLAACSRTASRGASSCRRTRPLAASRRARYCGHP